MSLTKERDGIEVPTPEHDKAMALPEERQEIGQEFYDWIHEQGWQICAPYQGGYSPITYPPAKVMALFLGIDYDAFNAEKDAIVRALQERTREHGR